MPLSKGDFLLLSSFILLKILSSSYKLSISTVEFRSIEDQMSNLTSSLEDLRAEMHSYEEEFEESTDKGCRMMMRAKEEEARELQFGDSDSCVNLKLRYAAALLRHKHQAAIFDSSLEDLRSFQRLYRDDILVTFLHLLLRILLLYGLWGRKRRILAFMLINPVLMYYLIAFVISKGSRGRDSIYVQPGGSSGPWSHILVQVFLLPILYYPIADHFSDQNYCLFLLSPQAQTQQEQSQQQQQQQQQQDVGGVGLIFYAVHVYFYLLLKKSLESFTEEKRKKKKEKGVEVKEKRQERKKKRPPCHSWFFHACLYGHKDVVRILLQDPHFDVNAREAREENTGLHVAVLSGERPVVQMLLDSQRHRVDVRARNAEGKTALELAVETGRWDMVKRIATSRVCGGWRNVDAIRLMWIAIRHDRFQVARNIYQATVSDLKLDDFDLDSYLHRCVELSGELQEEDVSDSKRQHNEKCLEVYKDFLLHRIMPERKVVDNEVSRNKKKDCDDGIEKMNDESDRSIREIVEENFECPVCSEEMLGRNAHIFACSNDHWICSRCLDDDRMTLCPLCREDFLIIKPKRCLTAERIARQIKMK